MTRAGEKGFISNPAYTDPRVVPLETWLAECKADKSKFEQAWNSLEEEDREWLGEDRFREMCQALRDGNRPRQLYRVVLGLEAQNIRTQRREITKRFRKIASIPQVVALIFWTDW